ncbi:hypothetical protein, partial [Bacteroides fragilis]|uniref:hypothetical protein n=1 Tax=Bacteroides fragilis TaxID=817 RepID=UPI0032EFF38A
ISQQLTSKKKLNSTIYLIFVSLLNFSSIPLQHFIQIKITKIKKIMNYENKQQEEKKRIQKKQNGQQANL